MLTGTLMNIKISQYKMTLLIIIISCTMVISTNAISLHIGPTAPLRSSKMKLVESIKDGNATMYADADADLEIRMMNFNDDKWKKSFKAGNLHNIAGMVGRLCFNPDPYFEQAFLYAYFPKSYVQENGNEMNSKHWCGYYEKFFLMIFTKYLYFTDSLYLSGSFGGGLWKPQHYEDTSDNNNPQYYEFAAKRLPLDELKIDQWCVYGSIKFNMHLTQSIGIEVGAEYYITLREIGEKMLGQLVFTGTNRNLNYTYAGLPKAFDAIANKFPGTFNCAMSLFYIMD